jgi:heptosyltransferase III
MKIALLQLARIGDIYQTAPAINAYKRLYPDHEIHFIVRHKFSEACQGLKNIDCVIELPTKEILSPLVQTQTDLLSSLSCLENWLMSLAQNQYDLVVNLSFSPLSSWITRFLEKASQETLTTVGYTRTTDGYLRIPDDMSAYVYAQCGYNKPNRFHLNEIFGTLLEIDLLPEDWSKEDLPPYSLPFEGPFIALQIKASQEHKSIPTGKGIQILNQLKDSLSCPIVLLGGPQDLKESETIIHSSSYPHLVNLTGQTSLKETFSLIQQASLFVGPDSSLQNMASLTQTPTLLLSAGHVNFYETGPRAPGSFVIHASDFTDPVLDPSRVSKAIVSMMNSEAPSVEGFFLTSSIPCYQSNQYHENHFQWDLLNYIYRGLQAPEFYSSQFLLAVEKLHDVNTFIIELLEQVQTGSDLKEKIIFLEQAEDIIRTIEQLSPDIKPIVSWYRTEKLRIGPGDQNQVLENTLHVHRLLDLLTKDLEQHCEQSLIKQTPTQEGIL